MIPKRDLMYTTRNSNLLPSFKTKHEYFRNSFFPSIIAEWNNVDENIKKSLTLNIFKSKILKFIRPIANNIYNCNNPYGLKLLTRLRLGLSHLREHKFRHSFQDTLNPLCSEFSSHFLLYCSFYNQQRITLMNILKSIDPKIVAFDKDKLLQLLLYGDNSYDISNNTKF